MLHGINPERLTIELSDADGNIVLSYQEHQPQELPLPDVAKAPLAAQDITSTDEAGLSVSIWSNIITPAVHRSITTCAAWCWIRWITAVTALAMLEYNRADFPQAVAYATQALKRAHALNKIRSADRPV